MEINKNMYRENKYRFYETVTNKFFYDVDDLFKNPSVLPSQILNNTDGLIFSSQFTGLKDKNGEGQDVFEGDIFEIVFKNCPDGFKIMGKETTVIVIKGVVVFIFGKFCIEFMHPDYKEIVYMDLSQFLKNEQKVVVGNIYENPEMISND